MCRICNFQYNPMRRLVCTRRLNILTAQWLPCSRKRNVVIAYTLLFFFTYSCNPVPFCYSSRRRWRWRWRHSVSRKEGFSNVCLLVGGGGGDVYVVCATEECRLWGRTRWAWEADRLCSAAGEEGAFGGHTTTFTTRCGRGSSNVRRPSRSASPPLLTVWTQRSVIAGWTFFNWNPSAKKIIKKKHKDPIIYF